MSVDKDLYRTMTIRFSLLKQDHVRLLEKMEQDCREGSSPISKNKLIIQCIEEHYAMLASRQSDETLEKKLKSYVDGEVQKIKREIGMEIYQDVFRMFAGGLAAAGSQWKPEMTSAQPEEQTGRIMDAGEVDLSRDTDIMDEVMKWS